MKKLVSLIVAFACILTVFCASVSAQTVLSTSQLLYCAEEISDVETLYQRAVLGIDELRDNTDLEITVLTSTTRSSTDLLAEQDEEAYVTSQLLRSEIIDGEKIDTYAATILRSTYSNSQSQTSGSLVSTIYFNYDTSGKVQMINTRATINTSGASRLVMTNGLRQTAGHNMVTTSSQYSNPSGTYYLNRCSSTWVSDGTGQLYLCNKLYFDSGSVTTTEFSINRYGNFW